MTLSCNPLLRGASNRLAYTAINESPVCEISASSRRESLSTKKSNEREGDRVSAKGKKRGRKRERKRMRERTGSDGDGRARKHLQRIGLARVFNPARGFLVGEIKRGQVKRDAKKIARHTFTHGTHFSKHRAESRA